MVMRPRTRPPIPGRLIMVGGQCRKVGKSSLIVDLIRTFPEQNWAAVKITPYTEQGCPVNGPDCGCDPFDHTAAIYEENAAGDATDTARFLAAGARRAFWVQTKEGQIADALSPLASALSGEESVIIESDALVLYWRADLFFSVLDPRRLDFKPSARDSLQFADAFVFRSPCFADLRRWSAPIPDSGRPRFLQPLGYALPAGLQNLVRQRFCKSRHHTPEQKGPLFS